MKWVRTALVASPVLFSFIVADVQPAHADDTRPSATNPRDDWNRPDSQNGAPDATDPNGGPRRDANRDTGRDDDRRDRDRDARDAGPRDNGPVDRELDRDLHRDERIFANSSGGGNGSGGGSSNGGNLSDYPGRDVHDWVFAGANAATARAIFHRCESDVSAAYRNAQHNFERSKDYRDAVAAERDAYDAYNAARQKALHSLADNGRYRTLARLRDELGAQLAERRATKDISRDEIIALATLKMNYASDARAMEVDAINGDGGIKSARDKMVTASAKVSSIRGDFDESLRDNPRITMAKRNLEDARIALITAQAYYSGAAASAGSAMDYAYYLHRNDVGRYDYLGNGYGSGYGYGSPYWSRY